MKFEGKIEQPPKPKNVFEMETENANYDIIYSIHNIPTSPRAVESADAIILEFVSNFHAKKNIQAMVRGLMQEGPYQDILKQAQKDHKPVYFVDMSANLDSIRKIDEDYDQKMSKLSMNEAYAGSALMIGSEIYYIYKTEISKKQFSRRDFLKAGAGMALGAYLAAPFVSQVAKFSSLGTEPDERKLSRKANKLLNEINYNIHPELRTTLIDTRNDLIAQKAERIGEQLFIENKKKPRIAIAIGAAHTGIERSLKDGRSDRAARIKKDLGQDTKSQGAFLRIDFLEDKDGNQGYRARLFYDPSFQ